jgi:hypothetical protein
MAVLCLEDVYGVRMLAMLIKKRFYRYGVTLKAALSVKKEHDFPWLRGL